MSYLYIMIINNNNNNPAELDSDRCAPGRFAELVSESWGGSYHQTCPPIDTRKGF